MRDAAVVRLAVDFLSEAGAAVIVMDRVNALAPGWSHVLSTTNDLAELEAFRIRVGAPRQAFHLRGRRPHLDLKWRRASWRCGKPMCACSSARPTCSAFSGASMEVTPSR